ncbi:DEAD-box ATP-dependent RNA helicase CshA [anaerobic digester metagenome]
MHFVATVLRRFGYDVGESSAYLTQVAREEVLEKLRLNKLKFLVATDVAARGIDIHELSHVFQYQPPQDHEAYVHRTGRTGRAGAAGVAISFVSGMEEIELEQIAKKFSIPMVEHQVPADEELETLISQRAVFLLESRLRKADNIQKERMQRFMRAVGELATNDDSRALLAMLVDEFYQATFHAPPEQPSEKMVDMVRPVPVEARQAAPVEGGRAEDEKRRRKRSRKKPGNGGEAREQGRTDAPQAPQEEDAYVPAPEAAAAPQAEAPLPQRDVAPAVEIGGEEPEDEEVTPVEEVSDGSPAETVEGQPAAAPKKRRRRRPRKSSAQKAEGAREGGAEQAPAEARPAARKEPAEPRPAEEAPAPKRADNDRGRSRGRKPADQPAEPAKPRKKIFLE